ncbi:MAG: hypothetical protein LC798_14705 [Chloroflexi bacterium]|nr:hypothetical protein [Chloroflexota bacterium]
MMLLPSPGVLDSLIRDRQTTLRTSPSRAGTVTVAGLRVRLGHALIVAGTSLSGERVEQPARPAALQRAA